MDGQPYDPARHAGALFVRRAARELLRLLLLWRLIGERKAAGEAAGARGEGGGVKLTR